MRGLPVDISICSSLPDGRHLKEHVREVEFINRVKDLFDEDPGRLMRSIS